MSITISPEDPWVIKTQWGNIDPADPDPSSFHLRAIARSLSHICRWCGDVDRFFSVAQHAVVMSHIAEQARENARDLAYATLHHDDPESIVGDHRGPMKVAMGPTFRAPEDRIQRAMAQRFGFPETTCDRIHFIDRKIREDERRNFLPWCYEGGGYGIKMRSWSPFVGRSAYLVRHNDLCPWRHKILLGRRERIVGRIVNMLCARAVRGIEPFPQEF